MRLHRPSLTVGIAVGLLSVAAVGGTASTAMAFVSCSNVASLDGYGGNPGSLTLAYNGQRTTLPWPFELRDGAYGNIFRPPSHAGNLIRAGQCRYPGSRGASGLSGFGPVAWMAATGCVVP